MTAPVPLSSSLTPSPASSLDRASEPASIVVDVRSLLAWTNHQIVALRRAMRHRHDDTAWWAARGITPPWTQAGRAVLRQVAHLLHVDRANARGRIHGNFESLDAQREWLASWERRRCGIAARYLGVPHTASLIALRTGEVIQTRGTDWCVDIDVPAGIDAPVEEAIDARAEGIDTPIAKVQS